MILNLLTAKNVVLPTTMLPQLRAVPLHVCLFFQKFHERGSSCINFLNFFPVWNQGQCKNNLVGTLFLNFPLLKWHSTSQYFSVANIILCFKSPMILLFASLCVKGIWPPPKLVCHFYIDRYSQHSNRQRYRYIWIEHYCQMSTRPDYPEWLTFYIPNAKLMY